MFVASPQLLSGLVQVLEWQDCSESTRHHAVNIMRSVCSFCSPDTQTTLLADLLQSTQRVAAAVVNHLQKCEDDQVNQVSVGGAAATDAEAVAFRSEGRPAEAPNNKLGILLHRLIQSYAAVTSNSKQAAVAARGKATTLDPLWHAINGYLLRMNTQLEAFKDPKAASSVTFPPIVLPLVESFFMFHSIHSDLANDPPSFADPEPTNPTAEPQQPEAAKANDESGGPAATAEPSSPVSGGKDSTVSMQFIEKNRRLLNVLVSSNISLLGTSLALLMKYPRYVDFENKRLWFREQIRREQESQGYGHSCRIHVRRANVFQDSFFNLNSRQAEELKGRLRVVFKREEGVDAGGLTREWFLVLSKEMFDPNYALFIPSAEGMTYQPNGLSSINSVHLNYFKFVGRVVGMALFHDAHLDCYFTRSFYKHMLGITPTYHDIESISPDYYKQLVWALENDVDDLEFTFSTEADDLGKREVIDLKPDGRNVPVTNENKQEFVTLITDYKMTKAIKDQIDAFLGGFYEIVPRRLISIFNEHELELLISGMPDVNIEDLKANTEYVGYTSASAVIIWFWQVIDAMNREEKSMLVQFITGSSKVPLGGFKDLQGMHGTQKFNIHRTADTSRLPSAHTCFNQLDLPEYNTFDQLKDMLMKAVTMGHLGFGFV
jgi:hypothetical protein|uniref:HECT-type E3 ubiquitin transferase n=1 Tax=Eutreptiella gymnastica TaxID=73025 RepID=A0A7S4D375_9EUGL